MTTTIFNFVRHGQSTSNVGLPSETPDGIVLTEIGHTQAKNFAESVQHTDAIVSSIYWRAIQTSKYLAEKFPKVPVFTSQFLHEINYLCPIKNKNTTKDQRKAAREVFMGNFDLHKKDGELSESLFEFFERIDQGILQLLNLAAEIPKNPNRNTEIHVFSHAFTISAILFRIFKPRPLDQITNKYCLEFFDFARALKIDNCQNIRLFEEQLLIV